VRGYASQHEYAGSDDCADAQACELDRAQHPAQAMVAGHFFQEHFERLSSKEAACHEIDLHSARIIVTPLLRGNYKGTVQGSQ
jgi:hypothetical protein